VTVRGLRAFILCLLAFALLPSAVQAAPVIHEFPVKTPSSDPFGIALGADGNMWFSEATSATETTGGNVGMITNGGAVTEFGGLSPNATAEDMTPGPAGKVWFTEADVNAIGSMTTASAVQEFPLSDGCTAPTGITDGPDGNLWFGVSCPAGFAVGRMTPTGTFTPFLVPTKAVGNHLVQSVAAGPDGNLWFTEPSINVIGRITTNGKITIFGGLTPHCQPWRITAGPNGNLWFTEPHADQIGEMTTAGGLVGEFPVASGSSPLGIAPAGDGTLWFTEYAGVGSVGQIAASGTVLGQWPLPVGGNPRNVAMGGSNVWFTESGGNSIGEVFLPHLNIRYVSYIPNFFIFKVAPLTGQGQRVNWLMESPGTHGIADSSGMRLFGFGPAGGPAAVPMGSVSSYVFEWAGMYVYNDPYEPAVTGTVTVPTLVSLQPGTTNVAQVVWAAADAPAGFAFDVQVRQPGSSVWITWRARQTILQSTFTPSDPLYTGPGAYSFRARLRHLADGTHSGYSKPASIALN
jgi:streptogramin lyase